MGICMLIQHGQRYFKVQKKVDMLGFDIHYQKDGLGSEEETSKEHVQEGDIIWQAYQK